MKKELVTDIYMTTEHRNDRKPKVTFNKVLNYVLVDALIIGSMISGLPITASAATNSVSLDTATVAIQYESDIRNCIYNANQVIAALESMVADGIITKDYLLKTANQLLTLENAINNDNKETVASDITAIIQRVDKILNSMGSSEGVTQLKVANDLLKGKIGYTTVTVAPLTQTTLSSVKVTYPTKFTDIKSGSTYYTAVTYLAKKGCIGGYAEGTFKATTKITNAKFICMLMRAVNPKLSRATKGSDWSTALMKEAYKAGIVKDSELNADKYNESLTRKNMVLWVSRALEYLDEDVEVLLNVENLVSDFDSITGAKYQDAVKEIYSAGIVANAEFKQSSTVTRGTAVTVILKTIKESARRDMSKVSIPTDNEAGQNADSVTLKATDKNRGLTHIGDTWVSKDGKKTVLTGIIWNGIEVTGFGSGIDLYTGLTYGGGTTTLKAGDTGGTWNLDSTYDGQPLSVMKDPVYGKTFSYFREQWLAISEIEGRKAEKVKNPKDGQMAPGCYFTQYNERFGDWVWIGPVY